MAPSTRIPDDCPAWLAQWIGRNDERLSNIETSLVHLVKRKAQKGNPETGAKNNDKVTFKWLVEKIVVPAMLLGAGYYIGRGG